MNSLLSSAIQVITSSLSNSSTGEVITQAEHNFIEVISFASASEITSMLDYIDKHYWIEFPVWARILSYRLLYLQASDDINLRRRIASGLRAFGPDWDDEADRLYPRV
jgi:hypothetical protein